MPSESARHFLRLTDVNATELRALLARAHELKRDRQRGRTNKTLLGKVLAMVFEKSSTRTRVSFEVGMFELGGHAVYLSKDGSQLGRSEPIEDTARVLTGYCDAVVIRTFGQERIETLARYADVPVVNGLSDLLHPCQVLADLFTVEECFGAIDGVRCAWVGDGNNMANSWLNAAGLLGLDLAIACPRGFEPDPRIVASTRERMAAQGRGSLTIGTDPVSAVRDADVVSTDVWASMGQEAEASSRRRAFDGFTVTENLLAAASERAIVLHCLPAHRGEEIAADVLEGPRSVVWQQAENRLHTQKAVLEFLLGGFHPTGA